MNWIKLTPESVLPENQEVLARIDSGLMHLYQIGFVTDQVIHLDCEEMEADITHYCLIKEPADVVKPEPVQDSTDFPFS